MSKIERLMDFFIFKEFYSQRHATSGITHSLSGNW